MRKIFEFFGLLFWIILAFYSLYRSTMTDGDLSLALFGGSAAALLMAQWHWENTK